MTPNINTKRKSITIEVNSWDLNLIRGLLDYELGNTDGYSDEEYDRMEEFIKILDNLKQRLYEEELK